MQDRAKLANILRNYSVKSGEFTLASGQKSNHYVDVRRSALTGAGATLIGRLLYALIREQAPQAHGCGGLTLGADPIITSIAIAAHAAGEPFGGVIVRKQAKGHGTESWLEIAGNLETDNTLVAIDDVTTTAGSMVVAIERMRAHGFTIDHAFSVVDREAGGRETLAGVNVELHSLFTLSELVE